MRRGNKQSLHLVFVQACVFRQMPRGPAWKEASRSRRREQRRMWAEEIFAFPVPVQDKMDSALPLKCDLFRFLFSFHDFEDIYFPYRYTKF